MNQPVTWGDIPTICRQVNDTGHISSIQGMVKASKISPCFVGQSSAERSSPGFASGSTTPTGTLDKLLKLPVSQIPLDSSWKRR